jgi:hypothetical protein
MTLELNKVSDDELHAMTVFIPCNSLVPAGQEIIYKNYLIYFGALLLTLILYPRCI